MKFEAERASFPAMGIDTVLTLSPRDCRNLVAGGFTFVVRYLSMLKPDEVRSILCSGLALLTVTTSRDRGWAPSRSLGLQDAERDARLIEELGLPTNYTHYVDLEGTAGLDVDSAEYVDAWAARLKALVAGICPGIYVGAQCGLSDMQLWARPDTHQYWESASLVPTPSVRGFSMHQLSPVNHRLPWGLIVDVNCIRDDFRQDRPTWIVGVV